MAGRSLNGLGLVAKWLVVPAALAAVGYFIVGPHIGPSIVPKGTTPTAPPVTSTDQSADTASGDTDTPNYSAPDVVVSSQQLGGSRSRRARSLDADGTQRPRRHRRHKTTTPPATP